MKKGKKSGRRKERKKEIRLKGRKDGWKYIERERKKWISGKARGTPRRRGRVREQEGCLECKLTVGPMGSHSNMAMCQ